MFEFSIASWFPQKPTTLFIFDIMTSFQLLHKMFLVLWWHKAVFNVMFQGVGIKYS